MTDTYLSAAALAGLPGMPTDVGTIVRRARRESWPHRKRAGRGGGREYLVAALPEATRQALLARALAAQPALPESSPAGATAPNSPATRPPVEGDAAAVPAVSAGASGFMSHIS